MVDLYTDYLQSSCGGVTATDMSAALDYRAGTYYLTSSDLSLLFEQITAINQRRWKVEENHKSTKSNTAFQKSPARTLLTEQMHFIASILAYEKPESLKVREAANPIALKSRT